MDATTSNGVNGCSRARRRVAPPPDPAGTAKLTAPISREYACNIEVRSECCVKRSGNMLIVFSISPQIYVKLRV